MHHIKLTDLFLYNLLILIRTCWCHPVWGRFVRISWALQQYTEENSVLPLHFEYLYEKSPRKQKLEKCRLGTLGHPCLWSDLPRLSFWITPILYWNFLTKRHHFQAPLPRMISNGRSKTYGLVNLAGCDEESSPTTSMTNQTGTLSPLFLCWEPPFSTTSFCGPPSIPIPHLTHAGLQYPSSSLSLDPRGLVARPCPRVLTMEPIQTPGLTLSLPEGAHRAVQEEASTRAREAGARLGRGRVRRRPGGAAGARSGSGSRARPAPQAPARAGHVVPRPPALSVPAAPGPQQPVRPPQKLRTSWGEGRGPKGSAPGGGAPRRGRREGRAREARRAQGTCFRGSRPAGSVRASRDERVVSQLFPGATWGRGRRTAEAPVPAGWGKGLRAGGSACAIPFSRPPGSRSSFDPGAGVRLAVFTHPSKQYPVPAWRCKPLKTERRPELPFKIVFPWENSSRDHSLSSGDS